ncbi:MAG: hypothetical protein MN733_34275, partial [Nitrososphaera sp.]|nr:hypothetical protein [Nitrososphaera sp.]
MALTGVIGIADALWGSLVPGFGSELSGDVTLDVENTFSFDSVATSPIYRAAANRIFFFGAYAPGGQLATHNFVYEAVANEFTFDSETGYDFEDDLIQFLGFTTYYHAGSFGNYIGFQSTVARGFIATATNTFDWIEHDNGDSLSRAHPTSNTLVLTQTATGGFEQDIFDDMGLGDTVDASNTTFGRPVTHQVIKQHVSYTIQGVACPEKEYTPYVGSSDDATYPAVSVTPPTLGTGTFTLTHPAVSPTTTLVLKNPTFGNTDIIRFTRIDRRTRGGDRKLFSDLDWGKTQTLELTVINICEPEIDEIIDFLNTSLGQLIGLLDWENRQWEGVII